MPRSFLVKKYYSYKKQNYRELECHAVQRYPLAELPITQDNSHVLTCYPTTTSPLPLLGMAALPGLLFPPPMEEPVSPTTALLSPLIMGGGPVDLSSCSPFGSNSSTGSASSSSDEEDGGRSSDPPSPDALAQHVFDCPHCTKSYSSPAALANHQLSHSSHQHHHHHHLSSTQGEEEQETLAVSIPSQVSSSQRPAFHCKHCPKEYTSLGALKMHIRSHTLPCVCLTCGKAFSRPWLLRGHIRTHTGERPFSCQHCNRAFADRSNLRAHLQTHSEVKKYQCTSCSRTFSRMSLLHKHSNSGCCPAS